MSETQKNQAFELKVNDRRLFDQEGQEREGSAEEKAQTKEAKATNPEAPPSPQAENQTSTKEKVVENPPPASHPDFHSLLLSLAMSVQTSLGMSPNPSTGQVQKDLDHAKQTIDWLVALEEKTQGNRSTEESQVLSALLYELRMAFVEAQK